MAYSFATWKSQPAKQSRARGARGFLCLGNHGHGAFHPGDNGCDIHDNSNSDDDRHCINHVDHNHYYHKHFHDSCYCDFDDGNNKDYGCHDLIDAHFCLIFCDEDNHSNGHRIHDLHDYKDCDHHRLEYVNDYDYDAHYNSQHSEQLRHRHFDDNGQDGNDYFDDFNHIYLNNPSDNGDKHLDNGNHYHADFNDNHNHDCDGIAFRRSGTFTEF